MRSTGNNFPQDLEDHSAFTLLQDEVDRTPQIYSAVLFTNAMNVNSPMPSQFMAKNPGVCLRLTIQNEQYLLACDRWAKLSHNIYSLHLAIRYFRQLEEWGIGSLQYLLAGFNTRYSAIVSGQQVAGDYATGAGDAWREFFGLGPNATLDDANAIYRHRAKAIGESDPEKLQQLNLAIQQARQVLGG